MLNRLSNQHNVLHGWVVIYGKYEAEPRLLQHFNLLFGVQVEVYPQLLQEVG